MRKRLWGDVELSVDFGQWMLGFNFYRRDGIWNIFVGPLRIGNTWHLL